MNENKMTDRAYRSLLYVGQVYGRDHRDPLLLAELIYDLLMCDDLDVTESVEIALQMAEAIKLQIARQHE